MHPNPDRLIEMPLFAGLTHQERQRVASWLDVQEQVAGSHLTREGAADYAFFVVDDGEAVVEHEGREIGRLGPGDVFGELAMLGAGRRLADVVAVTDMRIFSMFGTHFREMEMAMPSVEARLQEIAASRLSILDADME